MNEDTLFKMGGKSFNWPFLIFQKMLNLNGKALQENITRVSSMKASVQLISNESKTH
jgi:hypothetical protein